MSDKNPLVSICICNYNMADTLPFSLESLISQLDASFEVVIADDGSDDGSVEILRSYALRYPSLKILELERDPSRKLGETRNISIRAADGEYVMLHLDCDDVFGPYLKDFVEVFLRIEKAFGHHILLSGQHINMANRRFLLSHGPYLNIYRGEDRNLWSRLAKIDCWIPFDHVDFITRLPKTRKKRFFKTAFDTFDHMRNDFRSGVSLVSYVGYEIKKAKQYSLKLLAFRVFMLFPCWFVSRFDSKIPQNDTVGTPEAFAAYRDSKRGTYPELMRRLGEDDSLDFLSSASAKAIFLNRS